MQNNSNNSNEEQHSNVNLYNDKLNKSPESGKIIEADLAQTQLNQISSDKIEQVHFEKDFRIFG